MNNVSEPQEEALCQILYFLETLIEKGFFENLLRLVDVFDNYQIMMKAAIKEPCSYTEIPYEVDIPGILKTVINVPQSDDYSVTYVPLIQLITWNDREIFPQGETISQNDASRLQKKYDKFKRENDAETGTEVLRLFIKDFSSLSEEKKNEYRDGKSIKIEVEGEEEIDLGGLGSFINDRIMKNEIDTSFVDDKISKSDIALYCFRELFPDYYQSREAAVSVSDEDKPNELLVAKKISERIESKLELDPSKFYVLNEMVASNYLGGPWSFLLDEDAESYQPMYERLRPSGGFIQIDENGEEVIKSTKETNFGVSYLVNLQSVLYDLDKITRISKENDIDVFIEARLLFEGQLIDERILEIAWYFSSTIKPELRSLQNGVYCPLGKIEYIESLTYSLPVKERLIGIIRYIESLPLEEQKQATVKHIRKELNKIDNDNDDELMQINEALKKLYSINEKTSKKLDETEEKLGNGFIQTQKVIKNYENQVPVYFSKLSDTNKKLLKKIISDISYIMIPFSEEEKDKYIDIISSLGQFVGNICTEKLKTDITINNLKEKDVKKYYDHMNPEAKQCIENYSKEYGELYNKIRHSPPDKSKISFNETVDFILRSNEVLKILLL